MAAMRCAYRHSVALHAVLALLDRLVESLVLLCEQSTNTKGWRLGSRIRTVGDGEREFKCKTYSAPRRT